MYRYLNKSQVCLNELSEIKISSTTCICVRSHLEYPCFYYSEIRIILMQIYFSGSIRGMEPRKEWFQTLIMHLKTYGKVLTEHSFSYSYDEEIKIDDSMIWERDINWLKNSDAVVAEVSAPSLGVGYEIGKAEEWGKPVMCIYRFGEKKLSAMIGGSENCVVKLFKEEKDALAAIDDFLQRLKIA